ncbi:MAG: hypothetical protein WCX79_04025 [Candidatus Paceibacterota bacterium]
MKRYLIFALFVFSLLFGIVKTTSAQTREALGFFGGRISSIEAINIKILETSGYQCVVPGVSLSIIPIGSRPGTPTNYIIPTGIYSQTGEPLEVGQLILGAYGGLTTATCYLPEPPSTIVTPLHSVVLFGTSPSQARHSKYRSFK